MASVLSLLVATLPTSCAVVLGLERGELAAGDAGSGETEGGDAASDGGANAVRYAELVLADRPLAYYPFEERAGATTVRSHRPPGSAVTPARDGTVLGATLGVSGARGGIDGAMTVERVGARVELAWSGIPTGNAPFSVEAVVRPSAIDPARRPIISHCDTACGELAGYRLMAEGTSLVFERVVAGASESVRGPEAIEKDRWTHVAVTFDGVRLRLLVGGAVVDELRVSGSLLGTGTTLSAGAPTGADAPFIGRIDELAIYDRELAVENIAARAKLLAL